MPENGVPIILDRVVWAAEDHIAYLSPAVHGTPLEDKENPALFETPCSFLEERVQLVVPALAALLARPFRDGLGDEFPLARSYVGDKLD